MTAQSPGFERLLVEILRSDGPQTTPPEFIEASIAAARAATQRRPLAASLDLRAWPRHPGAAAPTRSRRAFVLGAVVVSISLAVAALAWSAGAPMPSPRSSPGPSATDATSRITLTDEPDLPGVPFAAVGLRTGGILAFYWSGSGSIGASLLDPGAGTWRSLAPPSMPFTMIDADPMLLEDGRVFLLVQKRLVAGDIPDAVIFDPTTEAFAPGIPATNHRSGGRAVGISDGRVLVLGGDADGSGLRQWKMELFDPASGQWSAAGSLDNLGRDLGIGPVPLPDGRLLLTTYQSDGAAPIGILVFDPTAGSRSLTDVGMPVQPGEINGFELVKAQPLPNGQVLFFSGPDDAGLGALLRWTPGAPVFERVTRVPGGHLVIALQDGRYLIVLGSAGAGSVWDPATGATRAVGPFTATYPSTARLPDGRVVLFGGYVRDAPIGPSGTPPGSRAVQVLRFE